MHSYGPTFNLAMYFPFVTKRSCGLKPNRMDRVSPVQSSRASDPGPQIIGITFDEVDVLSSNDWQLLLCQITRGSELRVVCWGDGAGPAPGYIPSTEFPRAPSRLDVVEKSPRTFYR